jgi:hypothetical protein
MATWGKFAYAYVISIVPNSMKERRKEGKNPDIRYKLNLQKCAKHKFLIKYCLLH